LASPMKNYSFSMYSFCLSTVFGRKSEKFPDFF